MADLPAPFLPTYVNLQDYDWMPLDVGVLRDSRMAAEAPAEAFRAAVMLWCAAWHQVPSGSLPNNDVELAKLAGFGRVVKAWEKVRQWGLHKFVLCTDGRYHHPRISEKAAESWNGKVSGLWVKECDRLRKEAKRRGDTETLALPPKPEKVSARIPKDELDLSAGQAREVQPTQPIRPLETDKASHGIPTENALRGPHQRSRREKPPPQSLSVGRAREPSADLVAGFFDLRNAVWPDTRAPVATEDALNDEARDFLEQGGTVEVILATVERGMRTAHRDGKGPPRSLKAFHLSIADAIASAPAETDTPLLEPADIIDQVLSDDDWRVWLRHFTGPERRWVENFLGPKPGQPGCKCPQRLLAEFDQQLARVA